MRSLRALSAAAAGAALSLAFSLTVAAQPAAKPPPPVRTLFVGVDQYLHGYENDKKADPSLHNLNGAVNDVKLIKNTLRTLTAVAPLPVDDSPPIPCWNTSQGAPPSITLLDGCATRQAIFDALIAQIGASPVNGVVLFYFAGHGSSLREAGQDQLRLDDQDAAYDSTILPADAWREAGQPDNDIRGRELKAVIDAAEARGVTVVTIFDSCHSGTATRDVDNKVRPPNPASRATTSEVQGGLANSLYSPPPLPPLGRSTEKPDPYRVHLAAAADDQDAQEANVPVPGKPQGEVHGLFTVALTDTLKAREATTYLEVAQGALRRLEREASHISLTQTLTDAETAAADATQKSQSEGPLAAPFLGRLSDESRGFIARVGPSPRVLTLEGGSVNLITLNSKFSVFTAPGATPLLATGTVTAVTDSEATLALDSAAAAPDLFARADAATRFWVQETWHDCGGACLSVAILGGDADERKLVESQLAPAAGQKGIVTICEIACVGGQAQYSISLAGPEAVFQSADGKTSIPAGVICRATVALQPGGKCDADWAVRLARITTAAARYYALTSLAELAKPTPWATLEIHQIFPDGCPQNVCLGLPTVASQPLARVKPGPVDIFLTNQTDGKLFRYLLLLGPDDFSVTVLAPPGYADDPAMAPHAQVDYAGVFGKAGRAKLLVLMTKTPINVASLHQEPVRDVDSAAGNELERLLLYANQGQRDIPHVGDFDVQIVDFDVRQGKPSRKAMTR